MQAAYGFVAAQRKYAHGIYKLCTSTGALQAMEDSLYAKMRGKARFDANLKATYSIKGQAAHDQECRIANLSSSGATACFPRTESLQRGAVVVMDIPIPNTILRIATEAEIMWTKQRFNDLISGIKFKEILSESMIQRLVKKTP